MKFKIFTKMSRKMGLEQSVPNNQSLFRFYKKILDFSSMGLRNRKCYKEGKMNQYF